MGCGEELGQFEGRFRPSNLKLGGKLKGNGIELLKAGGDLAWIASMQ